MHLFIEKGMRDVVSDILDKFLRSKANNKLLKSYNPKEASNHIIDIDTNNFYDYTMCKFLPTCRFKWVNHKKFDSDKYSSNSSSGCVLEVDLEYPKELHELHNDIL